MAEDGSPADRALRKIEAILLCTICQENLKEPKVLPCQHLFCNGCLCNLPLQRQGCNFNLSCPTCDKQCQIPKEGIPGFPGARYVTDLNEVRDILQVKIEDDTNADEDEQADWSCERGHRHVCQKCIDARNEMIAVINNMNMTNTCEVEEMASTVKTLKSLFECPKHKKHLDVYCDKCDELICPDCMVCDHGDHTRQCEPISNRGVLKRHKEVLTDKQKMIQEKDRMTVQAMEKFNAQVREIAENRDRVKEEIRATGDQMIAEYTAAVQQEINELTKLVDKGGSQKMKFVSAQAEDAEKTEERYKKCDESVEELLQGTKQQVLARKKETMQTMTCLLPQVTKTTFVLTEMPNIKFVRSEAPPPGEVRVGKVEFSTLLDNCIATGEGLTKAIRKEKASFELHLSCTSGSVSQSLPSSLISCQLSVLTVECPTDTSVTETALGKYVVSYTPVTIGSHQLSVRVGNVDIPQSPFKVQIEAVPSSILPISACPSSDIAIGREHIVIVQPEYIYVVDKMTGKRVTTRTSTWFGSTAFTATSATMLSNGLILLADSYNHLIRKLSTDGKFLGEAHLYGRGSDVCVHPIGLILVVDSDRHCIKVLCNDLSFFFSFGKNGSEPGKFNTPQKIAIDQDGYVYVTDKYNNRVQKFTLEGGFMCQFGKIESEEMESLNQPNGIAIDKSTGIVYTSTGNRVVMFDTNGRFKGDFFVTSDIEWLAFDEGTGFLYTGNCCSSSLSIYDTANLLQQVPLYTAHGANI